MRVFADDKRQFNRGRRDWRELQKATANRKTPDAEDARAIEAAARAVSGYGYKFDKTKARTALAAESYAQYLRSGVEKTLADEAVAKATQTNEEAKRAGKKDPPADVAALRAEAAKRDDAVARSARLFAMATASDVDKSYNVYASDVRRVENETEAAFFE